MAALFVPPLPITVAAAAGTIAGAPANLTNDHPGMVWRTGLGATIILDLGSAGRSYDTVALIGTNLLPNNVVRVRTGAGADGVGAYDHGDRPAYAGDRSTVGTSISIMRLPSRSERYVRIDYSGDGHPDGYLQVQRIVVGKAITTLGITADAELGFDDQSVISDGPGYRSVDEYIVLPSAKVSTDFVSDQSWRNEWTPMLRSVGNKRAILFVRDDGAPETWQTDTIFGPITSRAAGKAQHHNAWRVELTITATGA